MLPDSQTHAYKEDKALAQPDSHMAAEDVRQSTGSAKQGWSGYVLSKCRYCYKRQVHTQLLIPLFAER